MTTIFQKVASSRPKGLKVFYSWKPWSTQTFSDSLSQELFRTGCWSGCISALALGYWEESSALEGASSGIHLGPSLPVCPDQAEMLLKLDPCWR